MGRTSRVRRRLVPTNPHEYLRFQLPRDVRPVYYLPKRVRSMRHGYTVVDRDRPSWTGMVRMYKSRRDRDRAISRARQRYPRARIRSIELKYPLIGDNRAPRRWYVQVPEKYVPSSLSPQDAQRQLQSIMRGTKRPQVSHRNRRSTWVVKFKEKYGVSITNDKWIDRHLLAKRGIRKVLDRGRAAYRTTGSRPNQTKESWARARLASVLLGGPARERDMDIWRRYRRSRRGHKRRARD